MSISDLSVGPEIDYFLEEHLFGAIPLRTFGEDWDFYSRSAADYLLANRSGKYRHGRGRNMRPNTAVVQPYSTDDGAALRVASYLNTEHDCQVRIEFFNKIDTNNQGYQFACVISRTNGYGHVDSYFGTASHIAAAIALAAAAFTQALLDTIERARAQRARREGR